MHCGVPTELHVYPGAPRGYELYLAGTRIEKRSRDDLDDWIGAITACRLNLPSSVVSVGVVAAYAYSAASEV